MLWVEIVKLLLLVFVIFLLSLRMRAQTGSVAFVVTTAFLLASGYAEAAPRTMLVAAKESTDSVDSELSEKLSRLAREIVIYDMQGREEEALPLVRQYVRALQHSRPLDTRSFETYSVDLIRRSVRLGRYNDASLESELFVDVLAHSTGQQSETTVNARYRTDWLLSPLTPVLVGKSAAKAEIDLAALANESAQISGPFSRSHAAALLELFKFQERTLANARRRLDVAHRIVSIMEVAVGETLPAQTMSLLLDMGALHEELQERPQALAIYRRFVGITEVSLGEESQEFMETQLRIAEVLAQMGRVAESDEIARRLIDNADYAQVFTQRFVTRAKMVRAYSLARSGNIREALTLAQLGLANARADGTLSRPGFERVLQMALAVFESGGLRSDVLALAEELHTTRPLVGGDATSDNPARRHDLAIALLDEGRLKQALDAAKKSLSDFKQAFGPNDSVLAEPLNTLAVIYLEIGKPREAEPLLIQSVALTEATYGQAHPQTAKRLINLARVIRELGDAQRAIEIMERVGPILEGQIRQDSALLAKYYHEFALLEFGEAVKTSASLTPSARENMWVMSALGDMLSRAQESALRAQIIRNAILPEEHPDRSLSDGLLAVMRMMTGDQAPHQTVDSLTVLIASTAESAANLRFRRGLQTSLALAYAAQGNPQLAIFWGKEAVNAHSENIRNNADLGPEDLREFSRQGYSAHQLLVSLLVSQGRIVEAQQIIQMLKVDELYETFRGAVFSGGSRAELTGFERAQFSEYYHLRDEQTEMAAERARLERLTAPTAADKIRLADIAAEQKVQREGIVALIKRLETDLASAPVGQNNTSVSAEASQLKKAVDALAKSEPDAMAVGVQYVVSDNNLTILVTVPNGPPIAHQVKIERARLYQQVQRALTQLGSNEADPAYYTPTLEQLYRLLIEPIASDLQKSGAKTLMLSLDDQLRLLPFAALVGPGRKFLVHDYTLAIYNEAAGQQLEKAAAPVWAIAAMGLSRSVNGKSALNAVPKELNAVVNAPGVHGSVFLNENFTRQRLMGALREGSSESGFNVLHVASHFDFHAGDASASVLYLGDGDQLTLAEMASPEFSFNRFELVTYSACESGKAGIRSAGQELEGLSALTQRRGAQAVLATLWNVADDSTSRLMQRYYIFRQRMNKAEALRQAQLEHINSDEDRAPYRWAPFVLMGNWR